MENDMKLVDALTSTIAGYDPKQRVGMLFVAALWRAGWSENDIQNTVSQAAGYYAYEEKDRPYVDIIAEIGANAVILARKMSEAMKD